MTTTPTTRLKLTKVQATVMQWLSQSWSARVSHGNVVEINGNRVCTTATLAVLERQGLIYKDPSGLWSATDAGKCLSPRHGEVVDD